MVSYPKLLGSQPDKYGILSQEQLCFWTDDLVKHRPVWLMLFHIHAPIHSYEFARIVSSKFQLEEALEGKFYRYLVGGE